MAEGGIGHTESESDSFDRHISLYSRHSRDYVESVSKEICSVMTRLGYGEEIRRWRIEKYREMDRLSNARRSDITKITAGSKAEGLTCLLESDIDVLFVQNGVLCVESGFDLHTIPDDIGLFRMDTSVYPGHCRLPQERQAHTRIDIIHNALWDNGYGEVLLSSSLLLNEFSSALSFELPSGVSQHKRAGPSLPHTTNALIHLDRVFALRCLCPSVLQRWAARPRHWPSPTIVQKVIALGAFVTPVGFKGSETRHLEWRICLNTGESELVNNLCDTQTKVYVILKMILKDVLKPKNKEISSYILKNIVLWQGERNPQTQFHPCSLLHWLHDGLTELRTAIAKQHLQYYMIPERNLMEACGMTDVLQHKWVADITDMLEEGPGVILRLEKIRKAIIAFTWPMQWFSKKRMQIEMLRLEESIRALKCRDANKVLNDSDFMLNAIWIRLEREYEEVKTLMLLEGSSVNALEDIHRKILM